MGGSSQAISVRRYEATHLEWLFCVVCNATPPRGTCSKALNRLNPISRRAARSDAPAELELHSHLSRHRLSSQVISAINLVYASRRAARPPRCSAAMATRFARLYGSQVASPRDLSHGSWRFITGCTTTLPKSQARESTLGAAPSCHVLAANMRRTRRHSARSVA